MPHDNAYKLLFSHVRMVADLLQGFVKEPWVDELDLSTLDKVSGSYVSDDLRDRHSDVIWRVQWGPRLLYIYILLEFQSSVDPYMAVRIQAYISLLLQDLIRRKQLPENGKLPPVLPMVLYNGQRRWNAPVVLNEMIEPCPETLAIYQPNIRYLLLDEGQLKDEDLSALERNLVAAIFRLENSKTFPAVVRIIKAASQLLESPDSDSLQRAIIEWVRRSLLPTRIPNFSQPPVEANTLSELVTMLAKNEIDWTREWREQGLQEGLQQALQQALQDQRALLLRLARARFDDDIAEALAPILDTITDTETLNDIGEWIVTNSDKNVFIDKVKKRSSDN